MDPTSGARQLALNVCATKVQGSTDKVCGIKLNAASLEDQRTSLMSDADDFLNPFSSPRVCVRVFSFSFLGGQMRSPKTFSF